MASQLVSRAEICKALNYTAREIDDLVLRKQIPYVMGIEKEEYQDKLGRTQVRWNKKPGNILFPLEEILEKFTPRKSAPKPEPKPEAPEPETSTPF